MIDVDCLECAHKIGDYTGPLGEKIPVQSQFFKRLDGTVPAYGSTTTHQCPSCKKDINELVAVLEAVNRYLHTENSHEPAPDSST